MTIAMRVLNMEEEEKNQLLEQTEKRNEKLVSQSERMIEQMSDYIENLKLKGEEKAEIYAKPTPFRIVDTDLRQKDSELHKITTKLTRVSKQIQLA